MSWHVDLRMLEAYSRGAIDAASASSLEAHLIACPDCRARAAGLVAPGRVQRVWAGVEDRLDAPRPGFVERTLLRLRTPEHLARLLAATPSLSPSWLGALALALAFAVVAAHQTDSGVLLFLVLAPLLPVAGVAAAYSPGADPLHEVALAAPLEGSRLLLVRAAAVLTTTTGLAAVAALSLPALDWRVAAWPVPALALTVVTLAASTSVPARVAATAVTVAWTAGTMLAAMAADDRFAAFRVPVQLGMAVAAAIAAVVLERRRGSFDVRRTV